MKLAKTNRRQIINLGSLGASKPGLSRDETRVMRARLAEVLLKMHGKDGRESDPAAARRAAVNNWLAGRLF